MVYDEAVAIRNSESRGMDRARRGVSASAYVIAQAGARALLELLPGREKGRSPALCERERAAHSLLVYSVPGGPLACVRCARVRGVL